MLFLQQVLYAFLGGMFLNLMPCVLPVLSLKIFDFMQKAGKKRSRVFAHGLAFTAGVLASFWILAGILLILRQSGKGLGWGYQLQSPAFLVILCSLFFFFSLHLFGVFEVGYLFTRIRSGSNHSGLGGSFFSGITTTLVATPCTGPFMGTAMAYGFSQPTLISMLVFTSLGLGLAFPYLLLTAVPDWLRYLPKPGPWMVYLKQFMGFPLLATVIWLAWVFGRQTNVDSMAMLLGLLLIAGICAWILGIWMALHHPGHIRLTAALAALLIFLPSLIWVLYGLEPASHPIVHSQVGPKELVWEPYSKHRVQESLALKKPVFIDFTADWCITCKVNEKRVLSDGEVIRAFQAHGVTMLKADWTQGDTSIGNALEAFGRNSIPVYVLYSGKDSSDYQILPQILTLSGIQASLKQTTR